MLAKMNTSEELTLICIGWIGVLAGFIFEQLTGFVFSHLKGIAAVLAIIATIPVIIERYSPLVVRIGYKLNRFIRKIKRK